MTATVGVFVAEDEAVAREKLVRWIDAEPDLVLVGEASDGTAAVDALASLRPELLFLDVKMPGLTGLEILARLDPPPPFVVFTTAFDEYAVAAFDADATDYLLKPFGPTRFREAINRVRRRRALLPRTGAAPLTTLHEMRAGRVHVIPIDDVIRFEARDDYVAAVTRTGRHLLALRMRTLDARLEPDTFVRVHRSHLVRVGSITSWTRLGGGRWRVFLKDGSAVDTSREGGRRLRAILDGPRRHGRAAPTAP